MHIFHYISTIFFCGSLFAISHAHNDSLVTQSWNIVLSPKAWQIANASTILLLSILACKFMHNSNFHDFVPSCVLFLSGVGRHCWFDQLKALSCFFLQATNSASNWKWYLIYNKYYQKIVCKIITDSFLPRLLILSWTVDNLDWHYPILITMNNENLVNLLLLVTNHKSKRL